MRDIAELRQEINQLNNDILKAFIRRMEVSQGIIEYKKANALPVLDRKREEEVLQNMIDLTPEDLKPYTLDLFKCIMDLSKEYQNKLK